MTHNKLLNPRQLKLDGIERPNAARAPGKAALAAQASRSLGASRGAAAPRRQGVLQKPPGPGINGHVSLLAPARPCATENERICGGTDHLRARLVRAYYPRLG